MQKLQLHFHQPNSNIQTSQLVLKWSSLDLTVLLDEKVTYPLWACSLKLTMKGKVYLISKISPNAITE